MRLFIIAIAALLLTAAVQTVSHAVQSDSINCKGGIVSTGDSAGELIAKCGEPTYTLRREEKNFHRGYYGGRTISTDIIDDWSYNFGPNRFQYRIILTNGFVTTIESLDYGY